MGPPDHTGSLGQSNRAGVVRRRPWCAGRPGQHRGPVLQQLQPTVKGPAAKHVEATSGYPSWIRSRPLAPVMTGNTTTRNRSTSPACSSERPRVRLPRGRMDLGRGGGVHQDGGVRFGVRCQPGQVLGPFQAPPAGPASAASVAIQRGEEVDAQLWHRRSLSGNWWVASAANNSPPVLSPGPSRDASNCTQEHARHLDHAYRSR